ncbi:uncharacterized protein ACBT57_007362 isoform 1-T2 [Dama dama]
MSSCAARRGVAQRVLIPSRPRRSSRVFGGTRHSALRLRQLAWKGTRIPSHPKERNVHPSFCDCGRAKEFSRPWHRPEYLIVQTKAVAFRFSVYIEHLPAQEAGPIPA